MKCRTCGHDPDQSQQRRAAAALWAGMSGPERSAEMSRRRKKGIKNRAKKKGSTRRPNAQDQP